MKRLRLSLTLLSTLLIMGGFVVALPSDALTTARPRVSFIRSYAKRLEFSIEPSSRSELHGGVDHYVVYSGKNASMPNPRITIVPGDANAFGVSRLRPGRKYYFRIVAIHNDGEESWSTRTDEYTRPNRPRFLRAKERTQTSAKLKWRKPYQNIISMRHEIELYKVNRDGSSTPILSSYLALNNDNFLVVDDLEPGTRYYFVMRARILDNEWTRWTNPKYFWTRPEGWVPPEE